MAAKQKNSGKRSVKYPNKKGINLIQNDEKQKNLLMTILIVLAAIVLLELGLKYGVLDLYSKLNKAAAEYDEMHIKYVAAQNQLRDYDDVLMEYRTYSMDWMEKDTTGKYVSVDRRDVLDLIETNMMRRGTIKSLNVKDKTVNVEMSGMNLKQISQMCAELETSPIVESAILMSAGTDKAAQKALEAEAEAAEADADGTGEAVERVDSGSVLTFNIMIRLQRAPEEKED